MKQSLGREVARGKLLRLVDHKKRHEIPYFIPLLPVCIFFWFSAKNYDEKYLQKETREMLTPSYCFTNILRGRGYQKSGELPNVRSAEFKGVCTPRRGT